MTATLVMGLVMEQMRNMRVGPHRLARLAIGHALCLEPGQVAAPGDERDRAGNALVIDAAWTALEIRSSRSDDRPTVSGLTTGPPPPTWLRRRSAQKKIKNAILLIHGFQCKLCRFMSREAP